MFESSSPNMIDQSSPERANKDDGKSDTDKSSENVNRSKKSPSLSTSKRQQKDAEKAERLRLKEEKDKQRTNEKMRKEKEKNELKMKKEAEKQEKEERRRQKEEEKKTRQEQMDGEKKKKEESRVKEKKKKEEMKRKEEEKMEKKTQKEKELMKNFFIKTNKESSTTVLQNETSVLAFMPFELKPSMKLAPLTRFDVKDEEGHRAMVDDAIRNQNYQGNYLKELKSENYRPGKSGKTWPLDEDVVIISNELPDFGLTRLPKKKMKLLYFHDNYRPAYYGTWSKSTKVVGGRRPLAMDSEVFDYEFDSDEEWEEEEPGESISHSEGEDDGDDEGNDDNDDKFMVPHGYLSEGEGYEDDDMTPEALKEKRQMKARNWEMELKMNVHRIEPISIGVIRYHERPEDEDNDQLEFLRKFMAQPIDGTFPITLDKPSKENDEGSTIDIKPVDKRFRVLAVPEEAMPNLIKLVHGCGFGISKMVREFEQFWTKNQTKVEAEDSEKNQISKRQLEAKIREIASYKKDSMRHPYRLWYVDEAILEKYNLLESPVPSAWDWSCAPSAKKLPLISTTVTETPRKKILTEVKTPKMTASPGTPVTSGKKRSSTLESITKFMTPVSDAVMSYESAKRQARVGAPIRSEASFTPGENANSGSRFALKRNMRKRSSSAGMQPESKRLKGEALLSEVESSKDCIIAEESIHAKGGNDIKSSCYIKLFRCSNDTDSKVDVPSSEFAASEDVEITDLTDENEAIIVESKESAVPPKNRKMTSFFKTLSPLNK